MALDESIEVFIWNDISILQDQDVFKVGTDALLLGCWIPKVVTSPTLILDAGTGTGIIALMMAHYYSEAKIVAIDLEEAAVQLAHQNFRNSSWHERLIVHRSDVSEIASTEKNKYDLIVCNPPYYFNQLPSPSGSKSKAKHALVNVSTWMESLKGRLKSSGHICTIVPFESVSEWISAGNETGLYNHDRMDIYSFKNDSNPVRSLLHFTDELVKPGFSNLVIYEEDNTYSGAYLVFTGIKLKENKKPHRLGADEGQ